MSRSADVFRLSLLSLAVAAALPSMAAARDRQDSAMTREPDAQDVAMTPLNDLNLAKDEIPAVLLAAASDPYASDGLADCRSIEAAIARLDATLGPDMDVSASGADRFSTGRVAKSVVASFIPFRGVLRELTGAAEQERTLQAAIYAGAVRRGFLKGLGQQKGCAYPARPAFTNVASASPQSPPRKGRRDKRETLPTAPGTTTTFVSQPVIQPTSGR